MVQLICWWFSIMNNLLTKDVWESHKFRNSSLIGIARLSRAIWTLNLWLQDCLLRASLNLIKEYCDKSIRDYWNNKEGVRLIIQKAMLPNNSGLSNSYVLILVTFLVPYILGNHKMRMPINHQSYSVLPIQNQPILYSLLNQLKYFLV